MTFTGQVYPRGHGDPISPQSLPLLVSTRSGPGQAGCTGARAGIRSFPCCTRSSPVRCPIPWPSIACCALPNGSLHSVTRSSGVSTAQGGLRSAPKGWEGGPLSFAEVMWRGVCKHVGIYTPELAGAMCVHVSTFMGPLLKLCPFLIHQAPKMLPGGMP